MFGCLLMLIVGKFYPEREWLGEKFEKGERGRGGGRGERG